MAAAESPAKKSRTETPDFKLGTRALGSSSLVVSRLGYGAWPLSYEERPSEADAIAVLHRALDRGVRLIDSADAYCHNEPEKHHNERLIRKALQSYPDQSVAASVVVATKGVCVRPEGRWERLPTAEQIDKAITGSHEALKAGKEPIDLWQLHWCNPMDPPSPSSDKHVPLRELLAPMKAAVERGAVKHIGLSNCTLSQVKLAQEFLPKGALISVQNRLNMWDRSSAYAGILDYCQENGLAFLPWSPLGGSANSGDKAKLRDEAAFPNLNAVAKSKGCTPEALVLAYFATKWPCIVHITSARRPQHLEDTLRSSELVVSPEEVLLIDKDGDQGTAKPAYLVSQEEP